MVRTPGALTSDASSAQPLLTGEVIGSAIVAADRAEIFIIVLKTRSREGYEARVRAIAEAVERATPGRRAEMTIFDWLPDPPNSLSFSNPMRNAGATIRVSMNGPVNDYSLNENVLAIRRVLAQTPGLATIDDIALGIATCETLDRATRGDVLLRIARFAPALMQMPLARPVLVDRRTVPVGGAPDPLCGPDAHARLYPLTRRLVPTRASIHEVHRYAFMQKARLRPIDESPRVTIPSSSERIEGRYAGARVRLVGNEQTISVYGYARTTLHYDGGHYFYTKYLRGDTSDAILAVRARLSKYGRENRSVIVQLDPRGGQLYVDVRTKLAVPDQHIVEAIAGPDLLDQRLVRFIAYRDDCFPASESIVRALGDAGHRAKLIVRALGGTVDLSSPVAIDLLSLADGSRCTNADTLPYSDFLPRAIIGTPPFAERDGIVAVAAVFRLQLDRIIASPQPSDVLSIDIGNGNSAANLPPPVDRNVSFIRGEAAFARDYQATSIAGAFDISPDNANNFRPILVDRVVDIVRSLSMTGGFTMWSTPGQVAPESGDEFHTRFTGSVNSAALARADVANLGGYFLIGITPIRSSCENEGLALTLEAIRAAATDVHVPHGPLVGIDVAGPFASRGGCEGSEGKLDYDRRNRNFSVRLNAFARITYANS